MQFSYSNLALGIEEGPGVQLRNCEGFVRSFTKAESAWDIPYLNRKIFLFRYQIFKS